MDYDNKRDKTNNENLDEDFINQTVFPTIIFLVFSYILIFANFFDFLKRFLGDIYYLFGLIILASFFLALYVQIQKNSKEKIDFKNDNTIGAIIGILILSYPILFCNCTFPICLVFIYFSLKEGVRLYKKYQQIPTSDELSETESQESSAIIKEYEELTISRLIELDKYFNESFFKKRIKKIYSFLDKAVYENNLKDVEVFLSDGIYSKLKYKLNNFSRPENIDSIGAPNISDISILFGGQDKNYITIDVAIKTESIDYVRLLWQDKNDSSFVTSTIIIKLARRNGVLSSNKKGVLEGYCPNCEKPLNQYGLYKCPSCNTIVKSGINDWIVTDVDLLYEKSSEYIEKLKLAAKTYLYPKGHVYNILKYDPDFSFISIVDKINFMFWNIINAQCINKSNLVGTFTSKNLAKELFRPYLRNIFTNVVGVNLKSLSIKGMYTANGIDNLLCKVVWNGRIFAESAACNNTSLLLVLTRNEEVSSNSELNFAGAYCENCFTKSDLRNVICRSCGKELNDTSKGWVLSEILSFELPKAKLHIKNLNKSSYKVSKASNNNIIIDNPKQLSDDKQEFISSNDFKSNSYEESKVDFNDYKTDSTESYNFDDSINTIEIESQEQVNQNNIEDISEYVDVEEYNINTNIADNDSIKEIDVIQATDHDEAIQINELEISEEKSDIIEIKSEISSPVVKDVSIDSSIPDIEKIEINNTALEIKKVSVGNISFENKNTEITNYKSDSIRVDKNIGISKVDIKPVEINSISFSDSLDINKQEKVKEPIIEQKAREKESVLTTLQSNTPLLGTVSLSSSSVDLTKRIDISSSLFTNININSVSIKPIDIDSSTKTREK